MTSELVRGNMKNAARERENVLQQKGGKSDLQRERKQKRVCLPKAHVGLKRKQRREGNWPR